MNTYARVILALSVLVCSASYPDSVTIHNKTEVDLFGAVYYIRGAANRAGQPFELPAGKHVVVERPERYFLYDREIYFTPDITELDPELTMGQAQFIPHFNIGAKKGSTFYILVHKGILNGYSSLESGMEPIVRSLSNTLQGMSDALFKSLQNGYISSKPAAVSASVRTDAGLNKQEQQFLRKRKKITKKALGTIVGTPLADQEIPVIALCASGGGYRAMISFLGAYQGLQKAGMLDAVTYMAGLSGGAWGVSMATLFDDPIAQIAPRLTKETINNIDTQVLFSELWKKFVFQQPLSIIDVYGLVLAHVLLGGSYKEPMLVTLSEQGKRIARGTKPFPLYSAIITKKPYEWLEFSPYEVRSMYLKAAVPTWAFGSFFRNGKCKKVDPEQSLGFFMGVWGSAMSANMQEMYQEIRTQITSPLLLHVLEKGTSPEYFGSIRVLPAKVHNFTLAMQSSPRRQQEDLTVIDAGLDFNLPLPPLLGRAQIIIILDNSLGVLTSKAGELKKVEQYCQRHGLPFPTITYDAIVTKHCSVFFDAINPRAPMVIYMPLINNERYMPDFDVEKCMEMSYCGTQNFSYTAGNVHQLSGLAAFNVTESAEIIRKAIQDYVQARKEK